MKILRVPDGVVPLLRELVHERTGIYFDDDRLNLLLEKAEDLAHRRGDDSLLQYYYRLKDADAAEWDRLWEALSVQETYFWREHAQIEALVEVIVPEWFRTREAELRIWCAAGATGEEPYSIAIALAEAGHGARPISIVASDASPLALEKAKLGVYREKSFRALPAALKHKYFERVPDGWKLSRAIVEKVQWRRANLADPADVAALARVHVLFCRNVFIYFSKHAVRLTVAGFAARMARGSYLFVGAAESLMRLTTDFELAEVGKALGYIRV